MTLACALTAKLADLAKRQELLLPATSNSKEIPARAASICKSLQVINYQNGQNTVLSNSKSPRQSIVVANKSKCRYGTYQVLLQLPTCAASAYTTSSIHVNSSQMSAQHVCKQCLLVIQISMHHCESTSVDDSQVSVICKIVERLERPGVSDHGVMEADAKLRAELTTFS